MTLPPTILAIIHQLKTQDNLCTADPMFCVQESRRTVGIEADFADCKCWRNERDEEVIYDDDKDFKQPPEGPEWEEYGYVDHWFTVMSAFTRSACEQYIHANGHNHCGKLRIYVESFHRCNEMIELRKWLMSLESAPSLPANVSIARNEHLASDEAPYCVQFCGMSFYGNSPEECFEAIGKRLRNFNELQDAVRPFIA